MNARLPSAKSATPSSPGDSAGSFKESTRRRPAFLWGDVGDPEIGFVNVEGKFRMIVRGEPSPDIPHSECVL
jgi:hypothetical protein